MTVDHIVFFLLGISAGIYLNFGLDRVMKRSYFRGGFRAGYHEGVKHAEHIVHLWTKEDGPRATFIDGDKSVTTMANYPPIEKPRFRQ